MKRGSLSLPVKAAIFLFVFIIAWLGIGLFFGNLGMQHEFGSMDNYPVDMLRNKLRLSGGLFALTDENFEVFRGVEDEFYIAVKNPDDTDRCFEVMVGCVKAMTGGTCTKDGDRVKVGGSMPHGFGYGISSEKWFKVYSKVDVAGNEVSFYPVYIQIPNASGKYTMEMMVFKSVSGNCTEAVWDDKVMASKTFNINVKEYKGN